MFFPMDNKKSHCYLHKIDLINHLTHNGLFKKQPFVGFEVLKDSLFVCLSGLKVGRRMRRGRLWLRSRASILLSESC